MKFSTSAGPAIPLLTAAVVALVAFHSPLKAEEAKVVAGTLTCDGQGTVGLIVGSKENLVCVYKPAGGGASHRFTGQTTRIGFDVGVRGKSVMIWTVLGSTTQLPGERVGGTYAGVSADVAAGIGVGANILVGGNKNSVVLQPLSVKGETGINIAVGVSKLTLTPQP